MEIKEARLKAGLTQKALSEKIGVPVRTIQEWEAERHSPPEYVKNLILEKINQQI